MGPDRTPLQDLSSPSCGKPLQMLNLKVVYWWALYLKYPAGVPLGPPPVRYDDDTRPQYPPSQQHMVDRMHGQIAKWSDLYNRFSMHD